jgi:hypothetical protein
MPEGKRSANQIDLGEKEGPFLYPSTVGPQVRPYGDTARRESCIRLNPRRKFFHIGQHREVSPHGLPIVTRIGLAELLREFRRV